MGGEKERGEDRVKRVCAVKLSRIQGSKRKKKRKRKRKSKETIHKTMTISD